MYNVAKIKECLKGRIGFLAQEDIDENPISPALRGSTAGLYWDRDCHPLVTVENLCYIKPEAEDFNDWANSAVDASIVAMLNKMVEIKRLNNTIKSALADVKLYLGVANRNYKEVKQGRFVGFEIKIRNQIGLQMLINSIGTQFSEVNTELPLYIYNSSQVEPVEVINLNHETANSFQWHSANILIQYESELYDNGATWYIGYYEDDLVGQAINKQEYNFKSGVCATCDRAVFANFQELAKYATTYPFTVAPSDLYEDKTLFDTTKISYQYANKTWGLNFGFNISCDITSLICRQAHVFDNALLAQFAKDALEQMTNSTRENRVEELTKQKAMYQLDDRPNSNQKGLRSELEDAIRAIDFDFSDLGTACLPCNKKSPVRIKSM